MASHCSGDDGNDYYYYNGNGFYYNFYYNGDNYNGDYYDGDNYDYYDDGDDNWDSCCEPEEHHWDWYEAYDFCESTGMRQIASRDDDGEDRCSYHDNPNNADEYTHDCCATDFEVYMHGDRNYWISVTGARVALARLRISPRARGAAER